MSSLWEVPKGMQDVYEELSADAQSAMDAVEADVDAVRTKVQEFAAMLDQIRHLILRQQRQIDVYAKLGGQYAATYKGRLNVRIRDFNVLAAGFYPHTVPQEGQGRVMALPEIGNPVLIAIAVGVGVVGVSIAGCAWAVAAWETARWARDQTKLESDELDARVAAMQQGRTLQPNTLQPTAASELGWVPWAVGGVVALVGVAAAVPLFSKRG